MSGDNPRNAPTAIRAAPLRPSVAACLSIPSYGNSATPVPVPGLAIERTHKSAIDWSGMRWDLECRRPCTGRHWRRRKRL